MTELVFSKRDGWSHDDVNLFGKLAQRYLVSTEEHRGLTSCTVTEHNILHIASDAMRFSHPDNYWCFSFERAVRRYVTTKSNFKNIECTYAKKEARRELLKHLHSHIEGQPKQYKFSLEKMSATSLDGARHLMKIAEGSSHYVNNSNKGILVGGADRNYVHLSGQEVDQIKSTFTGICSSEVIVPEMALAFKSLLKPQQGISGQGLLYRRGEHIFVDMENVASVVLVERFLCLQIEGEHHKFLEGQLLPYKLDDDCNPVEFTSSGFPILCKDSCPQKNILPATSILRKALVFHNPFDDLEMVVVDFMRKDVPVSEYTLMANKCTKKNPVSYTFMVLEGDMIFINGTDPEPWVGKVLTVDTNHQIAKVLYYNKDGEREDGSVRVGLYSPERDPHLACDKISWNTILYLASGEWNEDVWEMMIDA
ncbi:PREDICTED: uncharacterized protein LOC107353796 [Acropora digitifera]|uniref:uncharacterized protein LOC107353796 n=1 Tax=Acropora digitifera TaxID=70779 RepID=UPI00077B15E9|nr:PREDICTED: uncharacterized protein LOC107353796 [Acropora digitifera]